MCELSNKLASDAVRLQKNIYALQQQKLFKILLNTLTHAKFSVISGLEVYILPPPPA